MHMVLMYLGDRNVWDDFNVVGDILSSALGRFGMV